MVRERSWNEMCLARRMRCGHKLVEQHIIFDQTADPRLTDLPMMSM